jgi:hypothetical protein
MIKDVMVHLDGTAADEARLAAVDEIAELGSSDSWAPFGEIIDRNALEQGGACNA